MMAQLRKIAETLNWIIDETSYKASYMHKPMQNEILLFPTNDQ